MEEEDSEQKQPTSQLGKLLLDLTNIPAYTHSDQDIHESPNSQIEGNCRLTFYNDYQINRYIIWYWPNFFTAGISKHEDIVKKFREEKQLARRQGKL